MQAKKMGYFLSTLLLFSGLIHGVSASPTTVSFRAGGVTIDLTFPEEAHPGESIWHNATITANIALTLHNLTVVIKAPVDSSWQEVFTGKDERNIFMQQNDSFPWSMGPILLPQGANGTLACSMYVNTSQSIDYSSYTFYTTQVLEMTYSELLEGYNVLNNTYNQLLSDYTALNNNYKDLQSSYEMLNSSYNELIDDYNVLNNTYNQLLSDYTALNNNYKDLQSSYAASESARNSLLGDLSELQSDYESLNSTFYGVQGNFTDLQAEYDALNMTYNNLLTDFNELEGNLIELEGGFSDSQSELNINRIVMSIFIVAVACLIAFIIYIKRKKPEPYVVIRKETVAMKTDEES